MKIKKYLHATAACFVAIVFLSLPASGASFDCAKAKSDSEKIICADAELSKLEEDVSGAYGIAVKSAGENKGELVKEQKAAWLQRELNCKTSECVRSWLLERKKRLSVWANDFNSLDVAANQLQAANPEQKGYAYIAKLKSRYGTRLKFENDHAREVVESFVIDCKSNDQRRLPLVNVMYAKLASLDGSEGFLTIRVDSRGEDVRIYDELVKNGKIVNTVNTFEINKWGEIRSPNGKLQALMNSCFGGFGPIWTIPQNVLSSKYDLPVSDKVKALLRQGEELNGKCRGGSGDSPKTQIACDRRDAVYNEIEKAGVCWGRPGEIGSDKHWVLCTQ